MAYYLYMSRIDKKIIILLTKTTAAQTEDALSYYRVRGLYFLAVVFVATVDKQKNKKNSVICYTARNNNWYF